MTDISIIHANTLTPSGVIPDALICMASGKIQKIESFNGQMPEGRVMDASGLVASPGWIDIQINGGFGLDFTDTPTAIWDVASQLPRYGTTSFLPTIITASLETVQTAMDVLKQGPPSGWIGAQPLGLHIEGPFLNPQKKGAHNPQYLQKPDISKVDGWSRENGIWLVTLAPEIEGAAELISVLAARKVIVSAGHSMANYEQARSAFEQGVSCVTHLYNAMPSLLHRDPGLSGAFLTQPDVVAGLIADGVHCHPAMLQLAWQSKGADGIALVTDAMGAMGMSPGKYKFGVFEINVDQVSARLTDSTLAGSILTTDLALQNMLKWCRLNVHDVLPALTSTPARLLNISNKGYLTPGADADLVLLTPSGVVEHTLIDGQVVFSR
jgi:N-acetylglucosamine-6-phosphate deacetylase